MSDSPRSEPSRPERSRSANEPPRFALPVLIIVEAEDGSVAELEYDGTTPITIGRGDDCEIRLHTKRASRRHARVHGVDGVLTIADLGSANGTFFDDERIGEHVLVPGDRVRIGATVIQFGTVGDVAPPAPRAETPRRTRARPVAEEPVLDSAPTEDHAGPAESADDEYYDEAQDGGDSDAEHYAEDGYGEEEYGEQEYDEGEYDEDEYDEGEHDEDADADVRAPISAPRARGEALRTVRTAPRPPASMLTKSIALAIPAVLLLVVAVIVSLQVTERGGFGYRPTPRSASIEAPADGTAESGSPPAVGEAGTEATGDAGDSATAELRQSQASEDLAYLEREVREGGLGWEVVLDLQRIAQAYPETTAGIAASKAARLLQSVRPVVEAASRDEAELVLGQMVQEQKFGEAVAAARFMARWVGDDAARVQYWTDRVAQLEERAASELLEVERELGGLVESGQPEAALRSLIALRARYEGTAAFGRLLPEWLDGTLAARTNPRRSNDERIDRREERIATTFASCRFADLEPMYHDLLSLELTPEQRVEANEGLVASLYLRSLFAEFLANAPSADITTAAGRLVRADENEVEFERTIGGQKYPIVKPWAQLSPVSKLEIFSGAVRSTESFVGLVLYAMETGNDMGAEDALVRLHKRDKGRELATILTARQRGTEVPEAGYVEYEGRLVTEAARLAAIAAKKEARERERELVAELRAKERSERLDRYIDIALGLRVEKKFELAHRALTEISEKGEGEVAARALRLIQDPFLAIDNLRMTGPSPDRIDFVVMGEGYPIEDDYQAAFLIQANSLVNLLTKEEPYREYESYLNFWACQLGSKDKGCDRIPGDVQKDTALGGKVEWDRFTVDNGIVMRLLGKLGEAGADQQAIVIGLDTAGVATGGGGVACMTVGNYTVAGHEVGHSFAGLHDEYDFEPGTDPNRNPPERRDNMRTQLMPPNLMAGSRRDDVFEKAYWKYWIDAGETSWWNGARVDVFEGGNRQPFNYWRPQQNCKMRNAGARMCVVCMEHMVKSIYRVVRPIDRVAPEEERTEISANGKKVFRLWPMMPATHELEVTWYLKDLGPNPPTEPGESEGLTSVKDEDPGEIYRRAIRYVEPTGRIVQAAEIVTSKLRPGWYRLRAVVKDPTEWVIHDPENLLTETRDWLIEVKSK